MTGPWAIDPTARTLAELFQRAAVELAEVEAVIDGDTRLTYGAWWRQAGGLAEELRARGVGPGDPVVLALPSSAAYAVGYAAAARIGAIATGVNPRLGSGEIAHIFARVKPAAVICGSEILDRLPEEHRDQVVPIEELHRFVRREPGAVSDVDPAAPAVIVWTSGTTGHPKGAWFDNDALRASAQGSRDFIRSLDRRLVPLPFVHAGFMTKVWEIVASGTTLVITRSPWRAPDMLDLLESERITVATGVPTQWEKLTRLPDVSTRDLSALRVAITSTAPASPDLIRRMVTTLGCTVMVRFATTESGPATGTRTEDSPEIIASTLGSPLPDAEIDVVDERGVQVPPGVVGAIRVRHPGRMKGYWEDPVETAKTLSSDGWIRTGDLGTLTVDGNLVISGRATEMYIRGGYNVYPREIENALASHPKIREVAVLGVDAPVIGEKGVAVVVPTDATDAPELDELRDYLRGRIADYKLPDELRLVDELPRTAFMKISRPGLRAIVDSANQGAVQSR